MTREDVIKAEIRKHYGLRADMRLFNNPVGHGFVSNKVDEDPKKEFVILHYPRRVTFGLAPGSSDLIGFVQQDGVARFLAVETKASKGREREGQEDFIQMVKGCGGLAGFARSVEDVEKILRGE